MAIVTNRSAVRRLLETTQIQNTVIKRNIKQDAVIRKLLEKKEFVTSSEIKEALERQLMIEISPVALRARISRWKQQGVLTSVRRGVYRLGSMPSFEIQSVPKSTLNLVKVISRKYKYLQWAAWNTGILNEFSRHQMAKSMDIVEVEAGFEEAVFDYLRDKIANCFLDPDPDVMRHYVNTGRKSTIIISMISKSPLHKTKVEGASFFTPKLEKILVDLFSNRTLFGMITMSELRQVFRASYKEYSIDLGVMLNYAKRRNKKLKLEHFLKQNGISIPKINRY